jgi:hypothetical protein
VFGVPLGGMAEEAQTDSEGGERRHVVRIFNGFFRKFLFKFPLIFNKI